MAVNALYKQTENMRIVSTQSENIKHDILNICELWISSTSVVERVSKLLDLLENASKDISYDTGWDYGWSDWYDKGNILITHISNRHY